MARTKITVPNLKAWRLHRRLTQLDLAIKSDVGEQTVIRIEKGTPAKELTIHRLAYGLGISARQLLEELPPEKQRGAA